MICYDGGLTSMLLHKDWSNIPV